MKIIICCPSYKRPIVKSFNYFGDLLYVYVAEKEYEEYVQNNYSYKENIIKVKNEIQGNVARIRNYIIEDCFEKNYDAVAIVDDDIRKIGYFEKNERKELKKDEIPIFLDKYSLMCKELGFKMWGVNLNSDKQCYMEYTPFATTSVVLGPFSVFLKGNECRYDERLPLKEDYDMSIQNLNKYRGILRINKFWYECEQSTNEGGCATYRNIEKEKNQLLILSKKWGSKIVKIDISDRSHKTSKKKTIDYNPVIKVPIKGV